MGMGDWEKCDTCPRCDKGGIQPTWEYCPECSFHIRTGNAEHELNADNKWDEFMDNRRKKNPNLDEASTFAEMTNAMKAVMASTMDHFQQKLGEAQVKRETDAS